MGREAPSCVLPQGTFPICPVTALPCPRSLQTEDTKPKQLCKSQHFCLPLLRCQCSGEHLQVQFLARSPHTPAVTPHVCSQAAFQPHDEGSRCPFVPPREVSPRQALEQQQGCMRQGQPFWQGQWVIKHQARIPSGANGCCLPNFHPG